MYVNDTCFYNFFYRMDLVFIITAILSGSAVLVDVVYTGVVELTLNTYFSGVFEYMGYKNIIPAGNIDIILRGLHDDVAKLNEIEKFKIEQSLDHFDLNKKRIIILASALFVLGNVIRIVIIAYSQNN